MNRNLRAGQAEETLAIVAAGEYRNGQGEVREIGEAVKAAVEGSILYRDSDFPGAVEPARRFADTAVECTGETTLAAASQLVAEGAGDVLALNFASARNPGGGFLGGSQAQEESLARSSALYACQTERFEFYEHNRRRDTCLYSDWMIHSPAVPVFRDDEGSLLDEPYALSILTVPAVNAGAVLQNEPDKAGDIEPVLRERARKLLWVAARHGHATLILGAWGCGVFRNEPAMIARLFGDLLAGEFAGAFDRVVMAVYDTTRDRSVFGTFAQRFGDMA